MGGKIDISIIAKTSFAIVAVIALLALLGFINKNIDILIQISWRLAVTVIVGGVAIAISKSYMADFYKFLGIIICLIIIIGVWITI
jgi:hypothetical protein